MDKIHWEHNVSEEWMRARRHYVTASEIHKYVPTTPTGRKRDLTSQWINWFGEYYNETTPDTYSTGAAARGHLLEPLAVDDFNHAMSLEMNVPRLYHWDDVILTYGYIGWSPDAVNVECPDDTVCIAAPGAVFKKPSITVAIDIKSYAPGKHYACALADKMELEERWQQAAAMWVCKTLQHVGLVLYNPDCEREMFVHWYDRDELADEIAVIEKINCNAGIVIDKINYALSNKQLYSRDGVNEAYQNLCEDYTFGLPY